MFGVPSDCLSYKLFPDRCIIQEVGVCVIYTYTPYPTNYIHAYYNLYVYANS